MGDTLSAREMEVLAKAWMCIEPEPKVPNPSILPYHQRVY
jgi:hypothetical protein